MDGRAFGVEGRANIYDAIYQLLRPTREIIFLVDGVRLESDFKMFREIFVAASHPAGRFDRLRRNVAIGIFLVVVPRIVTKYRIDFEQAEQKYQAGTQLDSSDVVHTMVAVSQIE